MDVLIATPLKRGRTTGVSSEMEITPFGKTDGIEGILRRYVSPFGSESRTVPPSEAAIALMSAFFFVWTETVIAAEALSATAIQSRTITTERLRIICGVPSS